MADRTPTVEGDLEVFRNQWRAEVSARTRPTQPTRPRPTKKQEQKRVAGGQAAPKPLHDVIDELESKSYHDLPDKEEQKTLVSAGEDHERADREPSTALEHYELAAEKESNGQLGDSIKHYRKAFKLDDEVHELYKRKHFPTQPKQKQKQVIENIAPSSEGAVPATIQEAIQAYADSQVEPAPPPTDASPQQRCYLGELPEEILAQILTYAALHDVACMSKLSLVCRRLAYLSMTEETIWRAVALESKYGFSDMLFRYICDVDGNAIDVHQHDGLSLDDYDNDPEETRLFWQIKDDGYAASLRDTTQQLLASRYAASWRQMFRSRPRIRFNGCYISTVIYTRAGGADSNSLSWGVPVHVVTYYRYLRFYRDGTVISLLTISEPTDVVHHLVKDNLHHHHGNVLPSAVMKGALRGRWRLTGPHSGVLDPATETVETEGEVMVETQGNPSKYTFEMRLGFGNAGKGARNNKLAWRSYHMRNRLTDDSAPFTLKHEKGFYWSRVRSFS